MALIFELDRSPDDALAPETRSIIDLAIWMCGAQGNQGIMSTEDGEPTPRFLSGSGTKAWDFIHRARAKVWMKAGLDPRILDCPQTPDDIDNSDGQSRTPEPWANNTEMDVSLYTTQQDTHDWCANLGVGDNLTFDPWFGITG